MSGETEKEVSGWTVDTLHSHMEALNDGIRDYINTQMAIRDERLAGMDKAAEVLHDAITNVPTDLQKAISHVREVSDLQFLSIDKQMKIRDDNAERKIRDDKVALEAAFKAQQDAATEQNKSNTLAIDKSEKATNGTVEGIKNQIEELKKRLNGVDLSITGIIQNRAGGTSNLAQVLGIIAVFIAVTSVIVTIILATRG